MVMFYICGIVNLLGDHMLCFEIEMLKIFVHVQFTF